MGFRLVELDKRPGLFRALDKLVMREAGEQAKTACGNLQMCAGLEAGIEGATHTVRQRRLDKARGRSIMEEAGSAEEEEETECVEAELNNLNIETAVTEEESIECLKVALTTEVDGYDEGEGEGEEEGEGI